MSKKILFGALLLLFVLTSCDKMSSTEKRLVDAMMSDDVEKAAAAHDEFVQWLVKDEATMGYDFPYMREKLSEAHIVQSPDSMMRCYSWATERTDTSCTYANVMQWKLGDNMAGYTGSLERLIANRKIDFSIPFTLAHSIDTIIKVEPVSYTHLTLPTSLRV